MKSGLIVVTKDILVQRDSDTTSSQMLTDPRAPAALGPRLDAGATDDRSDCWRADEIDHRARRTADHEALKLP